jgi:asparagine synthase (glutamine-hydrolysing)
LHLTLLFNDQRRHLAALWELYPTLGLEYQLPFFDRLVLEQILSTPPQQIEKHRVYHEIFLANPELSGDPWQTYPGHEPCPHAVDPTLTYQWSQSNPTYRNSQYGSVLARKALGMAARGRFPADILDVPSVVACSVAHLAGVRDFSPHLEVALLVGSLS